MLLGAIVFKCLYYKYDLYAPLEKGGGGDLYLDYYKNGTYRKDTKEHSHQ